MPSGSAVPSAFEAHGQVAQDRLDGAEVKGTGPVTVNAGDQSSIAVYIQLFFNCPVARLLSIHPDVTRCSFPLVGCSLAVLYLVCL